jgi:hypothetical protein
VTDTPGVPRNEPPNSHENPAETPDSGATAPSGQLGNAVITSPRTPPSLLGLVGIGGLNATCWLVGMFLGWLLDRHLGTVPVFVLVGLAIGALTGFLATYKEVRRYLSS